jgi:glycosyltransferase involved in cell wall biosynthesis
MNKISLVTSVYNAEKTLPRLLRSSKWVDEVIVVDNSSADATKEIALTYTKRVFVQPNHQMLNLNKNYGFEKATGDWILNLDADEEIPPDLKNEILDTLKNEDSFNGYWIPRQNIIFGKWIKHGIWWPDKQLRLFRNRKGMFPGKHVHEYLSVEGQTGNLTTPFVHYNYETVSQFIHKLDSIYTENEVANLEATQYHLVWQDAIKFPISDFLKIYFAQEGYKDGLHGLVLAGLQAFYSFIVFAKLWEKSGFIQKDVLLPAVNREIKNSALELRFWQLTSQLSTERNLFSQFYLKVKRKFHL